MFKTALRIRKISNTRQLHEMSWHISARGHSEGMGKDDLAWSKSESAGDLVAAIAAHQEEFGARTRRNAPLALRIACRVSPGWLEDATTPGTTLPRLFDQAIIWAEAWGGQGSVIAARHHPAGSAEVELLVSPVRDSRGTPVISTHKALRDLREKLGERTEYAALQTSWADWCAAHLDPAISRGIRRTSAPAAHRNIQGLWTSINTTDLPLESIEALSDLLLLRSEIFRHRVDAAIYTPPRGTMSLDQVSTSGGALVPDPWPFIDAIRSGALHVTDAAHRLGMSLGDNASDGYEVGVSWFPELTDRMHLAAVVAKCAAYCAQIEADVKNALFPNGHKIDPHTCWPHGAASEVERHEENLGRSTDAS